MFCSQCGRKAIAGEIFCTSCGNRLNPAVTSNPALLPLSQAPESSSRHISQEHVASHNLTANHLISSYIILSHPTQGIESIKLGFSWAGFLFPAAWIVFRNLWRQLFVFLMLGFSLLFLKTALFKISKMSDAGFLYGPATREGALYFTWTSFALLAYFYGRKFNHWRLNKLLQTGYQEIKTVQAVSAESALKQACAMYPDTDVMRKTKNRQYEEIMRGALIALVFAAIIHIGFSVFLLSTTNDAAIHQTALGTIFVGMIYAVAAIAKSYWFRLICLCFWLLDLLFTKLSDISSIDFFGIQTVAIVAIIIFGMYSIMDVAKSKNQDSLY